jgi:diguanylate cyclase (GGDEF)-like protein
MSDEGKLDHGNLVPAQGGYLAPVGSSNPLVSRGLVDVEWEIFRFTYIDSLTGIHNKRYLLEFLEYHLAQSARHHVPLSLIRLDIDHFKALNDESGDLAGDFTLREMVSQVKDAIRKEELFARYGGEEFVVVLPETNWEGGLQMSERLRHLVEAHDFHYEERHYKITISLGLVATEGDESLTPNDLIKQAEEKLSQAKRDGGNRVAPVSTRNLVEGRSAYFTSMAHMAEDGTLVIPTFGSSVDPNGQEVLWDGEEEITTESPDYDFWLWSVREKDCVWKGELAVVREEWEQSGKPKHAG